MNRSFAKAQTGLSAIWQFQFAFGFQRFSGQSNGDCRFARNEVVDTNYLNLLAGMTTSGAMSANGILLEYMAKRLVVVAAFSAACR